MSTRGPLAPPDPALVIAQAAAGYGVQVSPARAAELAAEIGRMLAAVDCAAKARAFEDEPQGFAAALREAAR